MLDTKIENKEHRNSASTQAIAILSSSRNSEILKMRVFQVRSRTKSQLWEVSLLCMSKCGIAGSLISLLNYFKDSGDSNWGNGTNSTNSDKGK